MLCRILPHSYCGNKSLILGGEYLIRRKVQYLLGPVKQVYVWMRIRRNKGMRDQVPWDIFEYKIKIRRFIQIQGIFTYFLVHSSILVKFYSCYVQPKNHCW